MSIEQKIAEILAESNKDLIEDGEDITEVQPIEEAQLEEAAKAKSHKKVHEEDEEVEQIDEVIKVGSKVLIHSPGKDYHGKTGHVGEIRNGAYKGAPKTYTVDYDYNDTTGRSKSIQLDKKNVKLYGEDMDRDDEYDEDEHEEMVEAKKKHMKVKEDTDSEFSMQEDIDALVAGEELTEEFKEKAATIFEAAVMNRVKEEVTKLDEAYALQLSEEIELYKEALVEKVDGYLDYVVEQWMEENEIALERGMKSEILEGFVGGLKNLFEEHYIDVPEEKFDVMESLEEEIQELNSSMNQLMESNVELRKALTQYEVERVVSGIAEGLVETDKEKFAALVEELEFDDIETFARKAQTIRESYFNNKTTKKVVHSIVTDEPVVITEEKVIPSDMKHYLSVLDNLK